MPASVRIRSIVVTSALVGAGEASWAALAPDERRAADAVHARLRAPGERALIARSIVEERRSLERSPGGDAPAEIGARWLSAWLRGADQRSREAFVRALSEGDVALIARARVAALPERANATAGWIIAQGVAALRRAPTVAETAALLLALRREREPHEPAVIAWERALRVGGRGALCAAFASAFDGATLP